MTVKSAPANMAAKTNPAPPEPTFAGAESAAKPTTLTLPPSPTGATATPEPMALAPRSKSAQATRGPEPNMASPAPQSVVGHLTCENQARLADDTPLGGGNRTLDAQSRCAAPDLLTLRVFAEVFEDLQKQRIATANRMERGGIDPAFMAAVMDNLERAEHEAALVMRRCYRKAVPQELREWQAGTIGIGEHLMARLVGCIGHPVHTTVYEWQGSGSDRVLVEVGEMDRTVSQLWSYCGHGDPARRRRAGMTAEDAAAMGNPRAKMLVHLMAECCMKQMRSPYRVVYDAARVEYEARDWTDLHRHNAALRKVGKAILKDLWIVAGGGHAAVVTHQRSAPSGHESEGVTWD